MASSTLSPATTIFQLCSGKSAMLSTSQALFGKPTRTQLVSNKGKLGMRITCQASSIPADRVPDMGKRELMNLLLLGALSLPTAGMLVPYATFFAPPGASHIPLEFLSKFRLSSSQLTRLTLTRFTQTRLTSTRLTPIRLTSTRLTPTRLTSTRLTPTRLTSTRLTPTSSGGTGGGTIAKDALGNDVIVTEWLNNHGPGDRTLTQGLKGDPTYLVVEKDRTLATFGINAVCTHLGCVVPWNTAENKFICPCHGSQYNDQGRVVRGPAPLSLALAHCDVDDGKVVFVPWVETDFRTGDAPWWA